MPEVIFFFFAFGAASSVRDSDGHKGYEQLELQCHIDCPSAFVKILDVDKFVSTTNSPGLSLVRVIGDEEKMEETLPLPLLIYLAEMP
jgi:hypothetical protein